MKSTLTFTLSALALLLVMPAQGEPLGRLFFSPSERAQLNRSQARASHSDPADRILRLDGIVQKNGGKRTAWINGVAQAVGPSDANTPASVPVPIPGKNKSVKLKVGQHIVLEAPSIPEQAKPASPSTSTSDQD